MKNKNLKNIQESGFKIPEGYFEDFENTIMDHAILKEKVKDSGFTVPKDYFNTLEDNILSNVAEKEPVKIISLINKKTIIYLSGIAATILLLFNIFTFNEEFNYDSLDIETVEHYILSENLETEELASLFNDSDFLEEGFMTINFSEEAIEDYAIDNLEINDLYIE